MGSTSPHYFGATKPTYEKPEDLAQQLAVFLDYCLNGRPMQLDNGRLVLDGDGEEIREHDASTVPTMTSAAWHCGFMSRQSLYDYEAKGDEWAAVVGAFREAMENWFVVRGTRPKKGDNPIFMSMILQAKFGYAPASKQVVVGDDDAPLKIEHQTPDDVKRVIEAMKVPSKTTNGTAKPADDEGKKDA